jgi:hypothetical protein
MKLKTLIFSASMFLSSAVFAQSAPQSFNVTWSAVNDTTLYQLATRVGTEQETVDDVTVTNLSVTKNIAPGQIFYAKARACTNIWCGDWSGEVSFTMPARPGVPNILGIQLIVTGQ